MLLIKFSLVLGIIKSSLPNEIPALKACLKPKVFILSQKITVSFCPQYLKIVSITSDTFFLVSNLLIKENLKWQHPSNIFQCRLQCMELCCELVCRFLATPWSYEPIEQFEKNATYWGSFPTWKEKDLLSKMLNYCFCEEHGNRYCEKK